MSRYLLTIALIILVPIDCLASSPEYSLFKIELIMAKKGDPDAQFNVGHAYEQGAGVRRDMSQALSWYRKAADQNHDYAQYSIGLFYEQGLGMKKNTGQAKKWYRLAAKNGNELAKQKLLAKTSSRTTPAKPAKKTKPAPARVTTKIVASPKPRPKSSLKPKPTTTQAQKRPEEILNIVFRNKWKHKGRPVDYLPSTATRCLPRGENEIICFTPELTRTLGDSLITYTAKATINDFTRDGQFTVDYLYNVTDISSAATPGPAIDIHGLQKQKGWQKTRLNLHCSASQPRRLNCKRDGKRYTFTK